MMRAGKLDEKELVPLLQTLGVRDPAVVLGPRFAEDAGVVRLGNHSLVASSDPVTLAGKRMGWYAVHINANDVAATGGIPRWFLATILLPESFDEAQVKDLFQQINEACTQLSVTVIGGHTEVTPGLSRPMVCGTMLGVLSSAGATPTGGACVGDDVILTKGICIEGAALLALDKEAESRKVLGDERWAKACDYLVRPGISVVRDAEIARNTVPVHAMHDPTEGGVAMGLYEMARAAGLGVEVEEDDIPVLDEARDLCSHFGLDPLRTLASGALLVCVAPGNTGALLKAYRAEGIRAARIGRITEEGYTLFRKGLKYVLLHDAQDQITKLFE